MDASFVKQLNLTEIQFLSEKLSLKQNPNRSFHFSKGVSSQDIYDISEFIKRNIWNQKNVHAAIQAVSARTDVELLYYYPASESVPIDEFLERAGLLNYQVAITDPLSLFAMINPGYKDAPNKNPDAFLKYTVENSLFLLSLAPWIETNQLLLLPGIELWDYQGWRHLGESNKILADKTGRKISPVGKEINKHFALENGYKILSESMRLSQQHYTAADIKQKLNISTEVAAEQLLKDYQSVPKKMRDIEAIKLVAKDYNVDDATLSERIERYNNHQIFDYENYLDVTKYPGGMHIASGMPMNMSIYVGDKLNAVPITDNLLNKLNFEMFTEVLATSDEYKAQRELVESKVDLDLPFMKGFSPEDIATQKKSGVSQNLKRFLNERWGEIRNSSTASNYKTALMAFAQSIDSDYKNLESDYSHIKQQSIADTGKAITAASGIFLEGAMQHNMWFAAGKSLFVLLGGAIKVAKDFDVKKFELKKNPLFIFLERKKGK